MAANYERIARSYDRHRGADPSIVQTLNRLIAPSAGRRYLDVGCGTGNYTHALSEAGLDLSAIDPSTGMLALARAKQAREIWIAATAEALPFPDGTFDGAYTTLAIHHFSDLETAVAEIFRVLRQGRYVMFTSDPEQMRGYWLNHYFPEMMARSTAKMPTIERVEAALRQAGFRNIGRQSWAQPALPVDHFLYCGKHEPELYLDPSIRAGNSSFAAFPDQAAIERGVARLGADIESGHIADVRASYDNDLGDYLFLHGEK